MITKTELEQKLDGFAHAAAEYYGVLPSDIYYDFTYVKWLMDEDRNWGDSIHEDIENPWPYDDDFSDANFDADGRYHMTGVSLDDDDGVF